MHEEHGVKFYLNAGVKEIVGEGGKVTGVTLPSGETLEAEVVVAGVGEPLTSSFTPSPLYIMCVLSSRSCPCYTVPERLRLTSKQENGTGCR